MGGTGSVGGRRRGVVTGLVALALALPVVPVPSPAAAEEHGPAVTAAFAGAADSAAVADVGQAIADRLLVTFRAGTTPQDAARVLERAGLAATVAPGFDVQVVDVDPDAADAVAAALSTAPEVLAVEPDRLLAFSPDADPLRSEQWWWRNVGQTSEDEGRNRQVGLPGMDIGAHGAWGATRGRGVVVAVVDTGIDTSHPDLRDRMWRNPRPGSFPGCAGDVHGCNFSGVGASGTVFANSTDDAHGTHVAGVVAATENGVGTVGIAPHAQVLSAKFLRGTSGAVSGGIRAIQYAVHSGADVINASWGVPGRVTERDMQRCGHDPAGDVCALVALERTIRDARIPVVVAAGNAGSYDQRSGRCQRRSDLEAEPAYPATSLQPNVIVVTAIDNRGEVPCFATTSARLVDVAAPGVSVLSTLPGGAYGTVDGTSQAAPMVTGMVALTIAATRERDGATIADAVRTGARPYGYLSHPTRPSGHTRAGIASAPGTIQALGRDVGACSDAVRTSSFRDRASAGVHAGSVDCIVHHRLASGFQDGTFRPQRTVTRGQVATFLAGLVRTARDLPVPSRGRFSDLRGDAHRDNVEALAASGIIDGHRDGTYRPTAPVTREQFASLLVRTYEHLAVGRIRPSGAGFPDVGGVHERNVRAGAQLGFIAGRSDGRFGPRDGVTRAQLSSLLRRSLDKLVNDRISRVR